MDEDRIEPKIVSGTSPVHGDWHPDHAVAEDVALVDVQLVAGPILEDVDFVTDYSIPSQVVPGGGRYCSLEMRLGSERSARLRRGVWSFLGAVSKALDGPEAWAVWCHADEDLRSSARHFVSMSGFCSRGDGWNLNGAVEILEVETADLDLLNECLLSFDSCSGLSLPSDGIFELLRHLTLADPWPSSRRYRRSGVGSNQSVEPLHQVLSMKDGALFFEEIDNGTRLRLMSRLRSQDELQKAVETHLSTLSEAPPRAGDERNRPESDEP